jgi:hypothetical protein
MLCALATGAEAAGGAYVVDDAQITPLNTCQVESWAAVARNKDLVFASAPACTVDIVVPVELKAELQRIRVNGFWASTINLQAKTNILPVEVGKIGLAVSGSATFEPAANQVVATFLNVPLTYAATDQLRFNVNVGWLYSPTTTRSWATWGAGFEWEFVRRMTLLVEAFGQVGPSLPELPALTDPRMQAGLRLTPVDSVDIDVIYGRNVTGVRTHWITVGLTARFGK